MSTSRNHQRSGPVISTASLPDIVFMLLFFFMTVTTINNSELLVENDLPKATAVNKLDKKDRIIEIYVGTPKKNMEKALGTGTRIQLNDRIAHLNDIVPYVLGELAKKPEAVRNFVTVSMKVDKSVKVGVVSDIKKELQKAHLFKVNYTTYQSNDPNMGF
ncbi:biopolymer transporter ExbD [Allomuricauda taeanensis]|uniref:ExbD/TolR family protein n=1 Tax=Flagellimonas taeanensis TaxID=1005926 RepID=UPI002E7AD6D0|nr:biopolymer transporter ExbD [Allomuricauda taeanensis]MEE1962137.1 biopolymer transporter ExbD [Allomuricauda taeanensis]